MHGLAVQVWFGAIPGYLSASASSNLAVLAAKLQLEAHACSYEHVAWQQIYSLLSLRGGHLLSNVKGCHEFERADCVLTQVVTLSAQSGKGCQ